MQHRPSNSTASKEDHHHMVNLELPATRNVPKIKTFNRTATTKGGAGLSLFSKPKVIRKGADKNNLAAEEQRNLNTLYIKTPSI